MTSVRLAGLVALCAGTAWAQQPDAPLRLDLLPRAELLAQRAQVEESRPAVNGWMTLLTASTSLVISCVGLASLFAITGTGDVDISVLTVGLPLLFAALNLPALILSAIKLHDAFRDRAWGEDEIERINRELDRRFD